MLDRNVGHANFHLFFNIFGSFFFGSPILPFHAPFFKHSAEFHFSLKMFEHSIVVLTWTSSCKSEALHPPLIYSARGLSFNDADANPRSSYCYQNHCAPNIMIPAEFLLRSKFRKKSIENGEISMECFHRLRLCTSLDVTQNLNSFNHFPKKVWYVLCFFLPVSDPDSFWLGCILALSFPPFLYFTIHYFLFEYIFIFYFFVFPIFNNFLSYSAHSFGLSTSFTHTNAKGRLGMRKIRIQLKPSTAATHIRFKLVKSFSKKKKVWDCFFVYI